MEWNTEIIYLPLATICTPPLALPKVCDGKPTGRNLFPLIKQILSSERTIPNPWNEVKKIIPAVPFQSMLDF